MSTQPRTHNESRAEFNGAGPTVDAEVSVAKEPILETLRNPLVTAAIGVVAGVVFDRKVLPLLGKGAVKVAENTIENID